MRKTICLAALAFAALMTGSAQAQDYCGPGAPPDVFYNYYVGAVPCGPYGGVGAALYPAPRPTPPLVGHTYFTYPPLYPHEFLYGHKKVWYGYKGPHAGWSKTTVRYGTRALFVPCENCDPPFASPASEYAGW